MQSTVSVSNEQITPTPSTTSGRRDLRWWAKWLFPLVPLTIFVCTIFATSLLWPARSTLLQLAADVSIPSPVENIQPARDGDYLVYDSTLTRPVKVRASIHGSMQISVQIDGSSIATITAEEPKKQPVDKMTYLGLSSVTVANGHVNAGDVIGMLGPPQYTSRAELRIRLERAGVTVSPENLPPLYSSFGQRVFAINCAGCHLDKGIGADLVRNGLLVRSNTRASVELLTEKVRNGGGGMPAFHTNALPDHELQAVVAFLLSEPTTSVTAR